ncbi:MAG: DNA-3-methyladenine glycosylase [Calditrichaeota bacterium]|nr:DNA-3-methyladenine glycosylase [Calditrichota bacterium]MCB9366294.1 DNA-3-methyladenine glycosylase [Calditrichota bacterium]
MTCLTPDFFARPTLDVAPDLVGCILRYRSCLIRIVEVEAYADDEASHGFRRTPRSAIMHDSFGHVYVYRSYGVHFCLNVTTDRRGTGAVLIRAGEAVEGLRHMRKRRGEVADHVLCRGPGNLTCALGVTLNLNESRIGDALHIFPGTSKRLACSTRIGISKAKEHPWRFFDPDSLCVSGPKELNARAREIPPGNRLLTPRSAHWANP